MIHNCLNFLRLRLSQSGFDPSFGNLACLGTLMGSDRMKQIEGNMIYCEQGVDAEGFREVQVVQAN